MRIASGRTDAKLAFVAVDSVDLTTRKTGLGSFTVYRSRNGGTATVYTTPTITELSAANMPGVYVLTIDEDTTITSGVDEEEYVVHITQASMAPVTRAIELFRPKTTEGGTNVTQTGDSYARLGSPAGASIAADIAGVQSDTDNLQTRIPAALGTGGSIKAEVLAIAGSTTSATRLQQGAQAIGVGVCDAGSTATSVVVLAMDPSVSGSIADQFKGRDIVFNSDTGTVALRGASARITANTAGGASPTLTVDPPLPTAPASLDVFTLQNVEVSTRQTGDSYARLGAPAGASVSADVAAVQSDTNDIQTRLPASLAAGRMKSDVLAVNGVADAAARASTQALSVVTAIITGTSSTATDVVADIISPAPAVTDQFKGRWLIFNADSLGNAQLQGQARRITGNTSGATPTITVTPALTIAPTTGDTFTIQGYAEAAGGGGGPTAAEIADAVLDEDMTAHQTQGTLGQAIGDPGGASGSLQSRVPAALTTDGLMKSDVLRIDGSADAANALEISSRCVAIGATNGGTNLVIETLGVVPAAVDTDQWKGLVLKFADQPTTAGGLKVQGARIAGNTSGATPSITLEDPLTRAPGAGEVFVIS